MDRRSPVMVGLRSVYPGYIRWHAMCRVYIGRPTTGRRSMEYRMIVNLLTASVPCETPGTRHGKPCDCPNTARFDIDGMAYCNDCMYDSGLREETRVDMAERGWIPYPSAA